MSEEKNSTCSVCERRFEVRFRYQVREENGTFLYFCSQACQQEGLKKESQCSVCGRKFVLEMAYQVQTGDGPPSYFCSLACRRRGVRAEAIPHSVGPRRIAVFNHKGGTGKTTTAVNLAAGLAERGLKTLLVDADAQGNVGASLGISGQHSLYHVLVSGVRPEDASVPIRPRLDVLTSNESLAAAELFLATRPNRHRVLRERLGRCANGYDVVVIDCAPALSLMNQNALVYADHVLVPVACDYLSLIGVKQVLRTLREVRTQLKHDVQIFGVLPTFFDMRNGIGREAMDSLREYFKDRCLPPIRVNTKLREAPSLKKTIFEHAPDSRGAKDYARLVEALLERRVSAVQHSAA